MGFISSVGVFVAILSIIAGYVLDNLFLLIFGLLFLYLTLIYGKLSEISDKLEPARKKNDKLEPVDEISERTKPKKKS